MLLSTTDQQLLYVTDSDIGQGPSNHTPPLYELLVSGQYSTNLTMEDITVKEMLEKKILEKILKEHEASIVQNNQEMFHKQEHSILALIFGNNS